MTHRKRVRKTASSYSRRKRGTSKPAWKESAKNVTQNWKEASDKSFEKGRQVRVLDRIKRMFRGKKKKKAERRQGNRV